MKKILGLLSAAIVYAPFVGIAFWLGKDKETMGLIAAGLFLFFGLIVALAVFSAIGFPDKDKAGSRRSGASAMSQPAPKRRKKSRDKGVYDDAEFMDIDIMDDADGFDD